jgi:hypothetical protein
MQYIKVIEFDSFHPQTEIKYRKIFCAFESLDMFSKIVFSGCMEIFFHGGVFEDSISPEFKISSLYFQKLSELLIFKIINLMAVDEVLP